MLKYKSILQDTTRDYSSNPNAIHDWCHNHSLGKSVLESE